MCTFRKNIFIKKSFFVLLLFVIGININCQTINKLNFQLELDNHETLPGKPIIYFDNMVIIITVSMNQEHEFTNIYYYNLETNIIIKKKTLKFHINDYRDFQFIDLDTICFLTYDNYLVLFDITKNEIIEKTNFNIFLNENQYIWSINSNNNNQLFFFIQEDYNNEYSDILIQYDIYNKKKVHEWEIDVDKNKGIWNFQTDVYKNKYYLILPDKIIIHSDNSDKLEMHNHFFHGGVLSYTRYLPGNYLISRPLGEYYYTLYDIDSEKHIPLEYYCNISFPKDTFRSFILDRINVEFLLVTMKKKFKKRIFDFYLFKTNLILQNV